MKYSFLLLILILFSCSKETNTIKIKGSDTEVNLAVLLAESYHETNTEVFVSISGGGSGLGIASLLNGTADIANSSRSINAKEIELFNQQEAKIDSFIFGQDAIAFVVAKELLLDSIHTEDLAKILSGEYTNWNSLLGENIPINIYGRQSNSGTHDFVKSSLGIEFTPYAKQMNGNAQILEAIKADHSGIGYVGAGYISKGSSIDLKVLSIYSQDNQRAVSPLDASMIAAGKYYFQRPLIQYFKASSAAKIKTFLDFEKSDEGKKKSLWLTSNNILLVIF
jgi:phosphate transport system substrate-binding protein